MENELSEDVVKYLQAQEEILNHFKKLIHELPTRNHQLLLDIQENIETLNRDAKEAKSEDIPAIMYQLNHQHHLAKKLSDRDGIPDLLSPYFGHMKIQQGGKSKDIYLGHASFSDRQIDAKIVDWKEAPIAKVFYGYDEGENFDLELEEREVEGTLLEKAVLTVVDGILYRIDRRGETLLKREGKWAPLQEARTTLQGGESRAYQELGTGSTNFDGPDILGLLDRTQYDIVNRGMRRPLLIVGGAGSGKTTVALIRIVKLVENKKVYPRDVLILVPNEGLVKLSKELLAKIGPYQIKVQVLDQWIEQTCRKFIPKLPRKVFGTVPLSVSILKRGLHVLPMLENYIGGQAREVAKKINEFGRGDLIAEFEAMGELPLLIRLRALVLASTARGAMEQSFLQSLVEEYSNFREDLLHIFTDQELMATALVSSNGNVTQRMINDTISYVKGGLHHFDSDQSYLREQNPDKAEESDGAIDREDFAILLNLVRLKYGGLQSGPTQFRALRHLVLDEAQEMTSLELAICGDLIHRKGSITVAGDGVQQIDPTTNFTGWPQIMEGLGIRDTEIEELNVSYRSPRSIVELAHYVLGPLAPQEMPKTAREGGPIIYSQVQHVAHASVLIHDALIELLLREPKASVAIICSGHEFAKAIFSQIEDLGRVKLVLNGEFSFGAGVEVTTVENIRGLEFDYVIIPDANSDQYPQNPRARKRLHLAATRAIHQLWILYTAQRSVLLPNL